MFFGSLGYQGQTTAHVAETHGFVAWPPSVARPNNHFLLEKVWVFAFGTPGFQQKLLAKKQLRDAFDMRLLNFYLVEYSFNKVLIGY